MMDVRFKQHAALGPSQWTYAQLPDFVFSLPLFMPREYEQPIPPLTVLNEIFTSGKLDAGMSGGCEWKPFEISQGQYDELVQELLTRPQYRFVIDDDLATAKSVRQWRGKVLSKYLKRPRR
jgi:hypothetical protein